MAIRTQYDNDIPDQWFTDYKKGRVGDEMVDKIFNILRSRNEYPKVILSKKDIYDSLLSLMKSKVKICDTYKRNNSGLDVLYMFYPNIDDVKRGNRNDIYSKKSMREAFFVDEWLKRSIKATLMYSDGIARLTGWIKQLGVGYTCNFKPSVAKAIYESWGPIKDCKVIDYSAGFGGRLLGAWSAENVTEYVGIDPNTETVSNANRLIEYLNKNYVKSTEMKILEMGSEVKELRDICNKGHFDIAFSSPPYFNTEVYSDDVSQSYNKYPNYRDWVLHYLKPTIENMIYLLKDDGCFIINIFDKLPNILKIIDRICLDLGWGLVKVESMDISVKPGNQNREEREEEGKNEGILVYKKIIR